MASLDSALASSVARECALGLGLECGLGFGCGEEGGGGRGGRFTLLISCSLFERKHAPTRLVSYYILDR